MITLVADDLSIEMISSKSTKDGSKWSKDPLVDGAHMYHSKEPNNRLSSMKGIPGYSIIPIRVSRPMCIITPPQSQKSSSTSGQSPSTSEDEIDPSICSEGLDDAQQAIADYTSVIKLETSGSDDDDDDEPGGHLIVFQELGCLKPKSALRMSEVQRSVGWNVDPFTKMPKFRDSRVNTKEIYHHCLKVLGRVGKSPQWVQRIAEDRMGFLSSLAIASAHIDLLRGSDVESAVTLAVKYEVLQMLRNSTTVGHQKTSDLTFMAITQFLSCEGIYGDRNVLLTHIHGLKCIANLRGGIQNLGWSDELALIAGGKMMILAIAHDFECPAEFLHFDYKVVPHYPSLCHRMPESPTYWEDEDLAHLEGARYCNQDIIDILLDMRLLTDDFVAAYVDSGDQSFNSALRAKIAFKAQAAAINARLASRPSLRLDPYYEIVRLTSLIYTTALQHCISFAVAADYIAPDVVEKIGFALMQTDTITCWYGDLAGVLFWCTLVASGASGKQKSPSGRQAARWLKVASMYNM